MLKRWLCYLFSGHHRHVVSFDQGSDGSIRKVKSCLCGSFTKKTAWVHKDHVKSLGWEVNQ